MGDRAGQDFIQHFLDLVAQQTQEANLSLELLSQMTDMSTYKYTGILADANTVEAALQDFVASYSLSPEVEAEIEGLGRTIEELETAVSDLEGVVEQLEQ